MDKQQLRKLIQNTNNVDILEALWEFYELKFMTKSTSTISTIGRNDNG